MKQLITEFKNFSGVDFTIELTDPNDNILSETTKRLSLISVLQLLDHLKSNLRTIGYHIGIMNSYHRFDEKIDELLDDDEKGFDDEDHLYRCGGNFAFFLQTKHEMGKGIMSMADNNEAGRILKKQYKEFHPDNQMKFDTEMSYCEVYTESREEAKKFMTWMNDTYFKPWVEKHLEGWEEFVELYKTSTEEDQMLISELVNRW